MSAAYSQSAERAEVRAEVLYFLRKISFSWPVFFNSTWQVEYFNRSGTGITEEGYL